jgi:hypothetical protein
MMILKKESKEFNKTPILKDKIKKIKEKSISGPPRLFFC